MWTLAHHLGKRFGYSCQTWLAVNIGFTYFGLMPRVWFATHLNARQNGRSSNPLLLFQELDEIVRTNDHHHARLFQMRDGLRNWILNSGLNPVDVGNLVAQIDTAPVASFRPQLWRIDLANIHVARLINLGQFPDEYLVRDLIAAEFTVFAE